ncbi:ABC transporter ATP-binding protein [Kaistia dalseonensis]|uniref:ATP-binding cassette subfamily B multidrug efflux pump n=1 Tax=Kaistia dalseonensis TaxID=410840 RepID=A0ABU0H8J8_9HYPH|nr:ABC transporter ATP-binding protein [Kaistia dalseonensis]MCX5495201.1 ABC transporter ATP-binding protein [Kaistia dalseonensis]MDQ0437786.1 ATP-binding cassette subfamily B multidrug efflux pump [Kaistia dalseonensis]
MLRYFEHLIDPFIAEEDDPPTGLIAFYRHFLQPVWPFVAALMAAGLLVSLAEVAIYSYVGRLVDMMSKGQPAGFFAEHGWQLAGMALVVIVLRPLVNAIQTILSNQTLPPALTARVRWLNHLHVIGQSYSFFQNDFSGRIVTKIVQTGSALTQSITQVIDALWVISVFVVSALFIFADVSLVMAVPLVIWVAVLASLAAYFVPRVRKRAAAASEARSLLTGKLADIYGNIQTVKLFARDGREEETARTAIADQTNRLLDQNRLLTTLSILLQFSNALLIGATGAASVYLWTHGGMSAGETAVALGLVMRLTVMSGRVMMTLTGLFDNVGTVEDGMRTIARPHGLIDQPDAAELVVTKGEIAFDHVGFAYGGKTPVLRGVDLTIRPGERIGLVGRSGAGKTTLVSLLLRLYDVEAGAIRIDGQDISTVTQGSLRAAIGVVTQDTALLNRSIRDNIRYGRPDADDAAVIAAARQASADGFIAGLADPRGRTGYDAHTGERGVKLSGGQRQRIAIARVLLKDAPILVLDEATSALDSEIEAVIQEKLETLMEGKTVIAIAHRLSTIAAMDRLVVMDDGRVVETGTHAELLAAQGLYAALWARQSGGFLGDRAPHEIAAE